MPAIQKVAVIGSGVMGSGIAAHIANAGVPVLLLDIVPKDDPNRNALAEKAVARMKEAKPSAFVHPGRVKLVTCGNLEDHIDQLKDCDWIVEAVLERLDVKQDVYRKVDAVRKKGAVVSSNTSTLPLETLLQGMPEDFRRHFFITHFFNPPRFMRLLELVGGKESSADAYAMLQEFADVRLGKGVVPCKDTPGFIANRIGVFWMISGLLEAFRLGISVEDADAVMGRPIGVPKTAMFGLFDLIGIDLMPLIAKSMLATLPEQDAFRRLYQEPELVKKMIADGYTGRKGKGGFYRMGKQGEKKIKEVIDLKSGDYHAEKKSALASVDAAKAGLRALVEHGDIGGQYAKAVLVATLAYTASLIPEMSDEIVAVDEAMRTGYSWKYGPFELIDRLSTPQQTGADWLAATLQAAGQAVPPILQKAAGKSFYTVEGGKKRYLGLDGAYHDMAAKPGVLLLSDVKLTQKPVAKNASAVIWDLGDGVACVEFTSKMNAVDPDILAMLQQAVAITQKQFKALVIGSDAEQFSVGANLAFMLMAANTAAWSTISDIIKQGQQTMMALKFAPFPVVTALGGMALGGGCEINLHARSVQAHIEAYPGLVEVGVGLIPGWGGCKEMLVRHLDGAGANAMPAISKVFETIMFAKTASSAEEARDMKILREGDMITMNRARLLADAKKRALQLAENYTAPTPASLHLPGETGKVALLMAVDQFVASGKATPHDAYIAKGLAHVLTGGDTDMADSVSEQQLLDLEHEVFMDVVKTKATLARIEHMLETGKPLRN